MRDLAKYEAIRDFIRTLNEQEIIDLIINLMPNEIQKRTRDLFNSGLSFESSDIQNALKLLLYLKEVKKIDILDDRWLDIAIKFPLYQEKIKKLTDIEHHILVSDPIVSWLLSSEVFQLLTSSSSKTTLHKAAERAQETDAVSRVGTNRAKQIIGKTVAVAPEVYHCNVALIKITNSEGRNETFMVHLNPKRITCPGEYQDENGYVLWLDQYSGTPESSDKAYYDAIKSLKPGDKVDIKMFRGSISFDDSNEIERLKDKLTQMKVQHDINIIHVPSSTTRYNLAYSPAEDKVLIWRGHHRIKDSFLEISHIFSKNPSLHEKGITSFKNRFIDYYQTLHAAGFTQEEAAKKAIEKYISVRESWLEYKLPFRGGLKLFFTREQTQINLGIARQLIQGVSNIESLDTDKLSNGHLRELITVINNDKKDYLELKERLSSEYNEKDRSLNPDLI
ncbi:hypothetical protein [Legionella parisiensis]|nr:hypothetical protein [Legionella parisiensis]KTD44222.1 hypothetical protein Lpar_0308 [Legionella parisiensis]STX71846.1 Uncharacterised protein [Legionella parisiensis]